MLTLNTKRQQSKILIFSFLLISFMPLLPNIFRDSQVHINFLLITLSSIYLLYIKSFKLGELQKIVLIYYLFNQLLLIPSLLSEIFHQNIGISVVFSFLRPTMLFLIFIALSELVKRVEFREFIFVLKVFSAIVFIWASFEILGIEKFNSINYFLYKREYRENLINVATIFFGTTYYAGFYLFSLFAMLLSYNKYNKDGHILYLFFLFLAIFLSQSKTIILATLIVVVYFLWISKYKTAKISFVFFLSFSLVLYFTILDDILIYLSNEGFTSAKQIYVLLHDTSSSDTLNARAEQIYYALDRVSDGFSITGVGLIPQDGSLESWIAIFLYRYGILGVLNFLFLIGMLSFSLYKRGLFSRYPFATGGLIWLLTLPLTQMSSAMIELSKNSFISALFLALMLNYREDESHDR
tara:strand:+ start:3884 stop:5113 length:1230 start_codon:yes stop_codon:yes gene_type:complete